MKIKNGFAPEKTDVDLSETEIEFISMLAAGVEKKKAAEILSMTYYKQRKLFNKLGLTVKGRKHHVQAVTLFMQNRLIQDEIYSELYKKYNLIECKKMVEKGYKKLDRQPKNG